MINRDTIFIGHANPEDNEFTLWLQSKLISEGFSCECDISFLLGGEADYWKKLQDFLEKRTSKYILIVSKITFDKEGVLDEWEHCKSIERQHQINDFIIPVKIDDSDFNARIGLNRRNIISFEDSWALGLKRLIKKINYDNVPCNPTIDSPLAEWYNNVYTNWMGVDEELKDTFYSNWVAIPNIPEKVFFYRFENEKQAKAVLKNNILYPAFRHGTLIITFQKSLNYYLQEKGFDIPPIECFNKKTKEAFEWYEDSEFPTYNDFRRLLVRLLNVCFESHLIDLDLLRYDLSNSKCYFFEHQDDAKVKGSFFLNGKKRHIGVTGRYYDDFWHYAISFKTLLQPEFCFSIKSHIVFTNDGKATWENNKQMHRARRKKGKNMRNKEWRNLLLAFLSAIANEGDSKISIMVAESESIVLSTTPIIFNAGFSYIEPTDKERLIPIDEYLDEEEYYIDIEEATEDA